MEIKLSSVNTLLKQAKCPNETTAREDLSRFSPGHCLPIVDIKISEDRLLLFYCLSTKSECLFEFNSDEVSQLKATQSEYNKNKDLLTAVPEFKARISIYKNESYDGNPTAPVELD